MSKYALCIGINDYPGTGSDLAGCVNDAKDWIAELKKRGFDVSNLFDRHATGNAIRNSIGSLLLKAIKGDIVVIQYSGHGSFVPDVDGDEPDNTDECICPYDVKTKGPITDDELFQIYSKRASGVKLFIISDSCHSGSVARFSSIKTPATIKGGNAPKRTVRFLPPSAFLSKRKISQLGVTRSTRKSSPPGRYAGLLMAGCQDTEFSYDAYFEGRPNGAFSFIALKVLKSLPIKATYWSWYKKIRKILPSQQYPQTPNLFGSSKMKKWTALE